MRQSSFTSRLCCAWFVFYVLNAYSLEARAADAAVTAGASDPRIGESQELMKQGATQFAQGNWHGAYLAYRKAWELTPHPAIAANMAATEIKLGMFLEAASHLKYALNHLPPVQMQKRDAVEQQLDEVRARLVAVSLSANLEGVEISIDGKPIGRTPLTEEVLLEPGHHAIRAEYAGLTQTKSIDVSAGARLDLLFDLSGAERPARPAPSSTTPAQPFATDTGSTSTRTWVLVGSAAATAISLGVGVATGIQAHAENEDAQTLRAQINSTAPSSGIIVGETCASREQSDACDLLYRNVQALERDRAISTGALVIAGVLGVATVATALLWPSKTKKAPSAASSLRELSVAPWTVPKSYGLSASVSF